MPPFAYCNPEALDSCIESRLRGYQLDAWVACVGELSAFFTSDRRSRPSHYLDTPERRVAYIAYFLRSNYNKLHAVLDEMKLLLEVALRSNNRVFRILDLGAGPGTMTLAGLEYLNTLSASHPFHFVAVEPVREMLNEAVQLFRCFRDRLGIDEQRARLETHAETVQQFVRRPGVEDRFDLIVMANAWNEVLDAAQLSLEAQMVLLSSLLDRLQPSGALILIEPALRETARSLHRLHDAVREQLPATNVFAPCVHQRACPCVAAGNQKDWCHAEFPWKPGERVTAIDTRIGNRKDALKFSYLVLRKDGKNVLDLRQSTAQGTSLASKEKSTCWRMVSELIVEKGKSRAFLCGDPGRIQFTRLGRHQAPANEAFDELVRGDLVRTCGTSSHGDEKRILEETRVERIE